MRRVISHFIIFSPNEQRGGEGGDALPDFFIFFISLFSRSRAGLATVYSTFFGLATYTLNVRNNNDNNYLDINRSSEGGRWVHCA